MSSLLDSPAFVQSLARFRINVSHLACFRALALAAMLALALAIGPLPSHAVVPTAAHAASTSMQLADGNPPQLPCTGGLPGPC